MEGRVVFFQVTEQRIYYGTVLTSVPATNVAGWILDPALFDLRFYFRIPDQITANFNSFNKSLIPIHSSLVKFKV
jgi:hypothetical protein